MADIIDISTRFKKPEPVPTVQELAARFVDEISQEWVRFATNNRLNEYFVQCSMHTLSTVNYLEDLNSIAALERKVGISVQVLSPEFTKENTLGWVASFRLGVEIVSTPPMYTEMYARCFNILMFLKMKRAVLVHNLKL